MAIHVVTKRWQGVSELTEFFTVRPNDFECIQDYSDEGPFLADCIDFTAVYRDGKRYTYVVGSQFTTYHWVDTCCSREYLPVEVNLRNRNVRVFDCDYEKTRVDRVVGFDKETAVQKAKELAEEKIIPFIPLEEPICSIL